MGVQSAPGDDGVIRHSALLSQVPVAAAASEGAPAGRWRRWWRKGLFGRGNEGAASFCALSEAAVSVAAFHAAFGLPSRSAPTADVPAALAELRVRLLTEETQEFAAAAESGDLTAVADALADVVYVAYGSAVTYGIDLDAVLAEVHRSNMSKLDVDGRPLLREDGKVLKSARYTPPDVAGVLRRQDPLPW